VQERTGGEAAAAPPPRVGVGGSPDAEANELERGARAEGGEGAVKVDFDQSLLAAHGGGRREHDREVAFDLERRCDVVKPRGLELDGDHRRVIRDYSQLVPAAVRR